MSWTASRKMLEVAIAAEQQTIPEEWDGWVAAEERLQRKLRKFGLSMWVMEGVGFWQALLLLPPN